MATILRFSFCVMIVLSVLPAYAKSPDSLPLPATEQNKPAGTNRPVEPKQGRGQLLYENHCLSCHDSIVHIRTRHKARSLEEVRQSTRRWAKELRLPWSKEEIDEVSFYLNARFYRFGQP